MSNNKKRRLDTLRVIIEGHPSLCNSPKLSLIAGEINRVATADRAAKDSGWLLAVLYTTRALDTTLSEILIYKGWTAHSPNLNGYLLVLRSNGILFPSEKRGYDIELVHARNKYMHEAGAMPREIEANRILNEMHACIALILSRL